MQTPDLYAVLGVAPTADLETIRRAYLKRAAQCHPDHGGEHWDMVLVNKAWLILRDPQLRSDYDAARGATADAATKERATQAAQEAQACAEQYPPRWSDFDGWLAQISNDFARAKYGTTPGFKGVVMPTATNSDSAAAFIFLGGAIGFVVAVVFLIRGLGSGTNTFMLLKSAVLLATLLTAGGAWLGKHLHAAIGSALPAERATRPHPSPNAQQRHRVEPCPGCGQKVRLPVLPHLLSVTCPKCSIRFDVASSR